MSECKDGVVDLTTPIQTGIGFAQQPNNIVLIAGYKEMIRLEPNGDIFVKGKLVENDKEVVEGLREFLFTLKR